MNKKRVLIVDDEEGFLMITKLNLEETAKFEVMTSISAKDIVSMVHKFKPDVILLDVLMPRVGGIEACEMLNNDSYGRNVPIIILSALDKHKDKLKAYKMGIVDYLVKPIGIDELILRIQKALRFK